MYYATASHSSATLTRAYYPIIELTFDFPIRKADRCSRSASARLSARRPAQIKGVHHLIFRPAAAALAQVGFHQVHFIGDESWAGVDGEGVGVVVEKPKVPGACSGASDGEVGALAVAKFGVEQRVRHECFQPGFITADADP